MTISPYCSAQWQAQWQKHTLGKDCRIRRYRILEFRICSCKFENSKYNAPHIGCPRETIENWRRAAHPRSFWLVCLKGPSSLMNASALLFIWEQSTVHKYWQTKMILQIIEWKISIGIRAKRKHYAWAYSENGVVCNWTACCIEHENVMILPAFARPVVDFKYWFTKNSRY